MTSDSIPLYYATFVIWFNCCCFFFFLFFTYRSYKRRSTGSSGLPVSSFEYQSRDFCCLCETLETELPQHKRDVLLFALANINLEIIEKKKEAFKSQIPHYAFLSSLHATVNVPGLSVAVDADLIADVVQQYKIGFSLDRPSLQRLADITGIPLARLTIISSNLTLKNLNDDFVLCVMSQSSDISNLTDHFYWQ